MKPYGINDLPQLLKQPSAPVYLLYGDEPLLIEESADQLRAALLSNNTVERHAYHLERDFDWTPLLETNQNLSLFATTQFTEIRILNTKPNEQERKNLLALANQATPDNKLLIIAGKLERATLQTAWYKKIEKLTTIIKIWPVSANQLPHWIQQRFASVRITPSPEVCNVLSQRMQGNLLALAQEIKLLHLLHGPGDLSLSALNQCNDHGANFTVYEWANAVLLGNIADALKILQSLNASGMAPMIPLWAITQACRHCHTLTTGRQQGQSLQTLFQQLRIWNTQMPPYRAALNRFAQNPWPQFLSRTATIEAMVKGLAQGDPWNALRELSLQIAKKEMGVNSFSPLAVGHI